MHLEAFHKPGADIHLIKEYRLIHPLIHVQMNMAKTAVWMFLTELAYRAVKTEAADTDTFDYLKQVILDLDTQTQVLPDSALSILTGLSARLGFAPEPAVHAGLYFDLREGCFIDKFHLHPDMLSAEASQSLNELLLTGNCSLPSAAIRNEMLNGLIQFYRWHIPGFGEMKSLPVLRSLMSKVKLND